jgi:ubiquinone/menaquinone biosynthesis C-methylase UbiE
MINTVRKYYFCFLCLFSICQIGCDSIKTIKKINREKEINTTKSNNYSVEECRILYEQFIKNIGIDKGYVIADIGAAWAYKDFAMSVLTDSVSYYIQDIKSQYIDEKELIKTASYYPNINNKPSTNSFRLIIGDERKTNLPDSCFDVIMLNNSLHEFTYVNDMIKDISRKLKSKGKVVVEDYFSPLSKPYIIKGCYVTAYSNKEVLDLMKLQGLYITNKMLPENNISNILVFEKNEDRSKEYLLNKEKIDEFLTRIKIYDSTFVNGDVLQIDVVSDSLILKRSELLNVYPSFESWINDIGYKFHYKEKYEAAIHIFKINVRLFPDSYNVYDSLGDAYYSNNEQELALLNYTKALELYPENIAEREKLEKLKKELGK